MTDHDKDFEIERERYMSHMEYRKTLTSAELEVAGRFTNASLTLAGGALALTITYVEKLHPKLEEMSWGWLAFAWFSLAASLAASLLALLFSLNGTHQAIKNSDLLYNKWVKDKTTPYAAPVNLHSNWTHYCNFISAGGFVLGLAAFFVFVLNSPPTVSQ
jgi:hypothetical protein